MQYLRSREWERDSLERVELVAIEGDEKSVVDEPKDLVSVFDEGEFMPCGLAVLKVERLPRRSQRLGFERPMGQAEDPEPSDGRF